jgi:hypothetical protein
MYCQHFIEIGGSLPHSQEAAIGPHPKPHEFLSTLPHPVSLQSILLLSSHLHLDLPSGIFSYGFPITTLY